MTEKSRQLQKALEKKGYLPELCMLIAQNLSTDYTAERMLNYLGSVPNPGQEELVDEMLAILSDRDHFVEKHKMESINTGINEMYRRHEQIFGLNEEEE